MPEGNRCLCSLSLLNTNNIEPEWQQVYLFDGRQRLLHSQVRRKTNWSIALRNAIDFSSRPTRLYSQPHSIELRVSEAITDVLIMDACNTPLSPGFLLILQSERPYLPSTASLRETDRVWSNQLPWPFFHTQLTTPDSHIAHALQTEPPPSLGLSFASSPEVCQSWSLWSSIVTIFFTSNYCDGFPINWDSCQSWCDSQWQLESREGHRGTTPLWEIPKTASPLYRRRGGWVHAQGTVHNTAEAGQGPPESPARSCCSPATKVLNPRWCPPGFLYSSHGRGSGTVAWLDRTWVGAGKLSHLPMVWCSYSPLTSSSLISTSSFGNLELRMPRSKRCLQWMRSPLSISRKPTL